MLLDPQVCVVLPGRFSWEKPARSGEVLPGASAPWPLQRALTLALPRWEDGVAAQVLLLLCGLVAGAVGSLCFRQGIRVPRGLH